MKQKIVLDLETKHSFDEVGGRDHIEDLGISVVGMFVYGLNEYLCLEESRLADLGKIFGRGSEVIGFSIKQFDLPVLESYLGPSFHKNLIVTDIMDDVERTLGFRVSLNNIAEASLGLSKSGHGLDAITWYREGNIERLKQYCLDDVKITKGIYEYGLLHGYFLANLSGFNPLFTEDSLRDGYAIPATWSRIHHISTLERVIERAFSEKRNMEIDYVSSTAPEGEGFRKKRVIEVRDRTHNSVRAYCFLREAERVFRIPRILDARIV